MPRFSVHGPKPESGILQQEEVRADTNGEAVEASINLTESEMMASIE